MIPISGKTFGIPYKALPEPAGQPWQAGGLAGYEPWGQPGEDRRLMTSDVTRGFGQKIRRLRTILLNSSAGVVHDFSKFSPCSPKKEVYY